MCEKCLELSKQEIPVQYFSKNGSIKPSTPVLYKKINFIRRAISVQGNKFCYKHIENINSKDKLPILCAKHGIFLKVQYDHINLSQGCPKCTSEGRVNNTISFIEKAKLVHRETYDYSLVEYTTTKQKVKILCKIHGIFEQAPNNHLSGNGCPKCGDISIGTKLSKSSQDFINESKHIHGDAYAYSLVDYKNSETKVKLICNNCKRIVEQLPSGHLVGKTPCECNSIKYTDNCMLYIMQDECVYKIGISSQPSTRLANLNRDGTLNLSIIYLSPLLGYSKAIMLEKYFHKHFKDKQYTELLDTDIDGKTELFNLEPEDIAYIKSYIMENI